MPAPRSYGSVLRSAAPYSCPAGRPRRTSAPACRCIPRRPSRREQTQVVDNCGRVEREDLPLFGLLSRYRLVTATDCSSSMRGTEESGLQGFLYGPGWIRTSDLGI